MAFMLSFSIIFLASSCDKEPVADRPVLPPIESLVMDFGDFNQQPDAKKGTETYRNFLHSYFTVWFWNVATTVTFAVPVTAYAYALQQDAVYLGDHTWEWAFDITIASVSYTVTLTGKRLNNEEFSMEMVVAGSATPEETVRWFEGVVRYDHTHATWDFFQEGTEVVLEAEWNKDFETGEGDLTYTYVEAGHEQEGSFIMLSYMPEEFYDAAYTVSLATGMVNIEWNTETREGRVKDSVKFGDSEWHCWDTAGNGLADKVCE